MNEFRTTDRRNQALAWGAILIAVGAFNLFPAGGVELLRPSLGFRIEVPFFPTLLIALGAIGMARGLTTRPHPAPDRP